MPDIKTVDKQRKLCIHYGAGWEKEALEDLLFALGDQWEKDTRAKLLASGRPCLQFNLIAPLVNLVSGYQRQSRSSIRAYPEGGEDQLSAEIATRLLKNSNKVSKMETKLSQAFEDGVMIGKAFLQPYFDDAENIITPRMGWRFRDGFCVRIDPASVEYDLSDARFIFVEQSVHKDDLKRMFPEKTSVIETLQAEKARGELTDEEDMLEKGEDYPNVSEMDEEPSPAIAAGLEEDELLLKEYLYYKLEKRFLAIDPTRGFMQLFKKRDEAEAALEQEKLKALREMLPMDPETSSRQDVLERVVAIPRVKAVVNQTELDDYVSPFYPNWKRLPLMPFFCHYSPTAKRRLKREDLAYKGIVRDLKDPQKEKNKRRSQVLHHVNASANSGWLCEEDTWVNPQLVQELGSTPGIVLEFKNSKPKPERLAPQPLPTSFVQMEQQAQEDIKMISGINADLLAMNDKDSSGRAIALRQQQGVLMLKRVFDNLAWTKEEIGRFILSQLGTLYTLDSAGRVLGEKFMMESRVSPEDVDRVLTDAELGVYDVSIGEGQESPTVRYANFLLLSEMAEKGYPIPPDVLLEYSDLPESARQRILANTPSPQAAAPGNPGEGTPAPSPGMANGAASVR